MDGNKQLLREAEEILKSEHPIYQTKPLPEWDNSNNNNLNYKILKFSEDFQTLLIH